MSYSENALIEQSRIRVFKAVGWDMFNIVDECLRKEEFSLNESSNELVRVNAEI